ncbi:MULTISPECIES: DUF4124 domain-containing protein [Acinetobacter]|uniref:DUF4124 domain-containing protein n=1 Tax=Acinetobacter TaxID=469 RepID=UPI000D37DC4A|nr:MULTISPECIES: DUF4124 domain-containing protein [Acinetobacter]PUR00056.1 hypothetical protein DCL20_13730 [Acinetobacter schindleri]
MKKLLLVVMTSVLLIQSSFAAEVYTCTVNGKTVYQGKPCPGKELNARVQQSQAAIKRQQAVREKERAERDARKEPRIGMTKSEAEKSTWGYPDKVNTTTTAKNEFEQWVYRTPYSGSKYLHFTNGKLTSISN